MIDKSVLEERFLMNKLRCKKGQSIIEYALILAVFSVIILSGMISIRSALGDEYETIVNRLSADSIQTSSQLYTLHELFNDDAFAEVMREHMNALPSRALNPIVSIDERVVTDVDCSNVTGIFVTTERGIQSLSGLNHLPNLGVLQVSNNSGLTLVPELEMMPSLYQIYLQNDNLTSLPDLSVCSYLQALHVDGNNLTDTPDLSFASSTLISLVLSDNALSGVFDVTNYPNLRWLYANDCGFTSINGIEGLVQLEYFYFAHNPIGSIADLSALTNMQVLYLDDCGLNSVTGISSMVNLTILSLTENSLTTCPSLSDMFDLEILAINDNNISTLPDLTDLTSLEEVYVGANVLTVFPEFTASSELRILNVSSNSGIVSVPVSVDLFADLILLDVSGTGVTSLPSVLSDNMSLVVNPTGLPYV